MTRIVEAGTCSAPCRVLLNGIEVHRVYACRVGSNGWVKRYTNPTRANKAGEAAKLPILRGCVEIVPL